LHWINNDTLSIFDFEKIPRGSIVTLHDEWLYCGSEHYYKFLDDTEDFALGYKFFKNGIYGVNWNYLVWVVKKFKLSDRSDLIYTVPSKWMLQRARKSLILKYADIRYLPNPIDTEVFRPMPVIDIEALRGKYSVKSSDVMICFGAIGGKRNYLKGLSLLDISLGILRERLSQNLFERIKLIDFGGTVSVGFLHGFRSISLGHIHDPRELSLLYSAADCVVVPSMVESFGQVAAESLSCGTPVVCFDTSGLTDMVFHQKTGLVAYAFEPESLADRLLEMIEMSREQRKAMGKAGRDHVIAEFSPRVVAEDYFKILNDAAVIKLLADKKNNLL
jgi:glycosyltransferase involved in cell wall biosynthesis